MARCRPRRPRPQAAGHGDADELTPDDARIPAIGRLEAAYAGARENLALYTAANSGQVVTREMRHEAVGFLGRWASE